MTLLTHLPYSSTDLIRAPTIPITSCCCRSNNGHTVGSSDGTARTWEAERKSDCPAPSQPGAGLMSSEGAVSLLRHFEAHLLAPECRHCSPDLLQVNPV